MPLISRTFVKAGMIFFALALIAGLLMEFDAAAFPGLMPLFWHMLMVGWITQIIFGVSIWMFPGRNREEGFKAQKWGWLTFIFLNLGLSLRVVSEPAAASSPEDFWALLLIISALLQVTAGITYLVEMWPRIQSKKQQRKNRKKRRQQQKSRGDT